MFNSEDPYFKNSNPNLMSLYDRFQVDPSSLYDGLDVMNMSKNQIRDSIGRVFIRQHMLSQKQAYSQKQALIFQKRISDGENSINKSKEQSTTKVSQISSGRYPISESSDPKEERSNKAGE